MSRKPVRRRRPGPAAKLRPFWFLMLLLGVLVALGAYGFIVWPALRPHTVDVSGNHVVPRDAIVAAAAIDMRSNQWLQNTRAMQSRIEQIPYVATASIHRLPPATLRIVVTERTPFARAKTQAGSFVVDRTLRVLQPSSPEFRSLPLLIAPDVPMAKAGAFLRQPPLPALRDDVVSLEAARILPASVAHDRFGDTVATLHDGIKVLLGDERDLEKKIALIDPILQQVGHKGRPIAAIDLRALSTPVVVYKK